MDTAEQATGHQPDELAQLMAGQQRRRGSFWIWGCALFLLMLVVLGTSFWLRKGPKPPNYQTTEVITGDLTVRIAATGNLQPTNRVDIGSELSGIIEKVFVDLNDRVTVGQELARLERSRLADAVARSSANLDLAKTQVRQAAATLEETRLRLVRLKRLKALSGGQTPAEDELDAAEAAYRRAEADLAGAEANVVNASANLRSDQTNLQKTRILSPINGIVLSRQIDPGQTVAASFQAPVLFTLAEDLSTMELQVDVDEADVGQVREGQKATFSVDAWPGKLFEAVITRVSYGAQTKDGVVSYPTLLAVDNGELNLRPGMTGTAEIITLVRSQALLVPNAALRFTPPVETETNGSQSRGLIGSLFPRPPPQQRKARTRPSGQPQVWVLVKGVPEPLEIMIGATDGRVTEVLAGQLKAGMLVITDMSRDTPR